MGLVLISTGRDEAVDEERSGVFSEGRAEMVDVADVRLK